MRAKLFIALSALLALGWAVPVRGTALSVAGSPPQVSGPVSDGATPQPVRLRFDRARGLLVTTWLNGTGPYVFVVDTGAGMNLVTQRLVDDAHLSVRHVRGIDVGGLTNTITSSDRETILSRLALGDRSNIFGAKTALVVGSLAPGIDGILDPTDIYAAGYSIDLPNQLMESLAGPMFVTPADRRSDRRSAPQTNEGAVVPWVRLGDSSRPFVRLGDGRLALIDTGSSFGLGVNERNAVIVGRRGDNRPEQGNRDIGGGVINSRRVAPTTISIGELVLRGVPTDILFGVAGSAPLILGRDALYPFKINFDPQRRLITFVTSEKS